MNNPLCAHCKKPLGFGRANRLYCDKRCKRRATDKRRGPRLSVEAQYGITWAAFRALWVDQGECCAVCKGSQERPLVDLDATKNIRGLLCFRCKGAMSVIDRMRRQEGFADYPV